MKKSELKELIKEVINEFYRADKAIKSKIKKGIKLYYMSRSKGGMQYDNGMVTEILPSGFKIKLNNKIKQVSWKDLEKGGWYMGQRKN